jgi:hypothetical protein
MYGEVIRAGFDVPADVAMKKVVFWAVTLYILKEVLTTWSYFPEGLLFVIIVKEIHNGEQSGRG